MVAVTFSLPDESRDFIRALRVTNRSGRGVGSVVEGRLGATPVVVWHIGVGVRRASTETARLLAEKRPKVVVCAGYGGALRAGMALGELVYDARNTSVPAPAGCRAGKIHTASEVAEQPAEKQRLGETTGALAVDMETEVLAAIFEKAGVEMVGLRAISDRMEDTLPVPMAHWFDLERQCPRVGGLLAYLARHPASVAPFFCFVRGLAPARAGLAKALLELVTALKIRGAANHE